jgi:voltage-gated potassium channel
VPEGTPSYVTPALARWRARTDGPLIVLAIGTLPFLLLELGSADLPLTDKRLIAAVNVLVLVAFALDYIVELRLASDRRRFVRHEWTSLLIVVSQLIAVVPGFQAIGVLRALRGVRGMRAALVLIRLLAIGGATRARAAPTCASTRRAWPSARPG